ncbi:hypothetical protein FH972_002099 [Carpinus fangiana]|uniref:DYW domain-containing protein n=1 Tax=Carpinus fangiana TaxID=176857 RepID=A0A5N6QH02_9ROSI|nr:hypothetical protein FH972_002099 [Carpinus fangiana]
MKEKALLDHITFVGVLAACRHGGFLDEGWMFFESMVWDYRIDPIVQHYTCMVDLLGHSGRVDQAYNLITQMRVMPDACVWELMRLEGRMKEAGYVPGTRSVFHDVEDDEKTNMVCSHSERLAIAFGLISTLPGTRLLITKNLRVCEDCHVTIKFISKIIEREMTIRDVNRYHHFKDAICSCGDFW